MRLQVTVRHLRLENGTKEYAEEKIVKTVAHYIGTRATAIEIELSDAHGPRSGEHRSCKVNVSFPRIKPLHVEAFDPDIRRAIDLCVAKIERVVKRAKTKRKDSVRSSKKKYDDMQLQSRPQDELDELEYMNDIGLEEFLEEDINDESD